MPIENYDYFIRYLDLPPGIHDLVRLNSDGTFSMYLNPSYDFYTQLDDYVHELWHIIHDDHYGEKNIRDIEDYLL